MKILIASLGVLVIASPLAAQNSPPSTDQPAMGAKTTTTQTVVRHHKPVKHKVRHHRVVRHAHTTHLKASVKTTTKS